MAHRTKDHPARGKGCQIEAFGEKVEAHEGETVAGALLAANLPVLSRSVKYHRPRGPFCLTGRCSHCLTRIDGVPNQFACRVECKPGMRVEAQNVLGSARFDALSAIDFLFPRGLDHHEMFAGVPVVEGVVAGVARHLAGLGTLPEKVADPAPPAEERRVELAVVGGGPAGLALAREAAQAGVRVEVVDDGPKPGGRLLCGMDGDGWLDDTLSALRRSGARLSSRTLALGSYRDANGRFLALRSDGPPARVAKLYADRFAYCTGGAETLPVFDGNDLPGIFAARGLLKLIRTQGIVPGERAAVLAEHPEGLRVAEVLAQAGCKVVAVVDPSGKLGHPKLPVVAGRITKASGGRLSRIKVEGLDGKVRAVSCDLLAVSAPVAPSFELARQAGLRADFLSKVGFTIGAGADGSTALPGIFVAGELTGPMNVADAIERGKAAGRTVKGSPKAEVGK